MSVRSAIRQKEKADSLSEEGLAHYFQWELDQAVDCFRRAAAMAPDNADYHLNLARALARSGDYDLALKSIAEFLRHEPNGPLASRFQQIFPNALDKVETILTEEMSAGGAPLEEIGAALQMWLEFRVATGRESIAGNVPQAWAAALDFTVQRVNFRDSDLDAFARRYETTPATVRKRHKRIVHTLDIMPCDYRYFTGKENPLDKLVEAALMLEEMERHFSEI